MPVPYNKNFTTYKSTQLQGLDCQTTGVLYYTGDPAITREYNAYFTAAEAIEAGECIAMLRVPRGFTVTDVKLYWTANASAVIGVGDPFCCGRFLGPITTNLASSVASGMPQGTNVGCTFLGTLTKIGRSGDGCGFGYTYTCDTDLIVTNGYGGDCFQQGGGSVGGTTVSTGTAGGSALASGTVIGLTVKGYINTAFTNPS